MNLFNQWALFRNQLTSIDNLFVEFRVICKTDFTQAAPHLRVTFFAQNWAQK